MLEQMRRQGASIFVYLIFCLLILIFVINFRPGQSRQGDNGCRGTSNAAITVDGVDATQNAFQFAYSINRGNGKQKTYIALEILIRRELLAQAADARGLMVDEDLVMDEIKQGHFYFGGQTLTIPGIFDDSSGDHIWNGRAFEAWYRGANLSRNAYIEEQKRSLLAAMMADILKESVQVSRDEALNQFLFENNTATYDVVAFKPEMYRSALQVTDADIDRYAASHADEIAARFKTDERIYKGTKPALRLREIFIAKSDGSGAMTPDAAKAKLEQVKKDVGGDAQKFAAAAKELSTDPTAKASGGELGWHTAENAMLGDKAVTDAVKTLKPGETTPVISTDKGTYLVLAEDKREGDLKLDQVKHEIAEALAKDAWSKEAAKRAAIAALDKARSGVGTNLDQLYKPAAPPPGGGGPEMEQIQKILNDPNTSPEVKQQLLKMLSGEQHGQIVTEGPDQPAGWFADDSGAVGSTTEIPGSTTVTPGSTVPPGSAVTPRSAATSGSTTPPAAAGSGAGSAAAPAAPQPVVATNEPLPAMSEVAPPSLEHIGPAPRQKQMPGLGTSAAAIAAVFDELQPGNLAKQVYEADGGFIVLQLRERQQPNVADFNKSADQRVAQLRATRADAFLEGWLKTRCETLAKAGKIIPNSEKIIERDDNGKVLPVSYRPCISFR